MAITQRKKPDIVQSFDIYKDREYYKPTQGFLFGSEKLLRTDRLSEYTKWQIACEKLPDEILVNGKKYILKEA